MVRVIAGCLLSFCCVLHARADWPQFRGPTGQGQSSARDLPTTWSANGQNVRWKVELPKSGDPWSSPVVRGDKLFLTFADKKEPRRQWVSCYGTADGKALWSTDVPPGPWTKSGRNGYATPVVDDQHLFAAFGSAVVACLDLDGKLVWTRDLPSYEFDVAMSSSPVLWRDLVILQCDQKNRQSNLLALDKKTGQVRYNVPRPDVGHAHGTPIIARVNGGDQLLLMASSGMQGIDPATGKVLWQCKGRGDAASPAVANGIAYGDSGRGSEGIAVDLSAIPAAGDAKPAAATPLWKTPKLKQSLGSPVIVGPHLYRQDGDELYCWEVATGKEVYVNSKLAGGNSRISPFATADGLIYFCSGGRSFVVRAGPVFELVALNDLQDGNDASAAVSDGRIYIRGAKYLWCIGK